MKKRLDMRRRKYSEVQGKVVDYISHSIDDGDLCMNVCFKDKTLFSFRFAWDMFIVGADLSDWKTGMATTLEVYTHASGSAQRDAVNMLADQLFPNVRKLDGSGNASQEEPQVTQ